MGTPAPSEDPPAQSNEPTLLTTEQPFFTTAPQQRPNEDKLAFVERVISCMQNFHLRDPRMTLYSENKASVINRLMQLELGWPTATTGVLRTDQGLKQMDELFRKAIGPIELRAAEHYADHPLAIEKARHLRSLFEQVAAAIRRKGDIIEGVIAAFGG